MRVVTVEQESKSSHVILWGLTGAAVGVAAGILLSEKLSGHDEGGRTLLRRVRALARLAGAQWVPLMDLALDLRDQWKARGEFDPAELYDDEFEEDEFEDDDLDDEDDEESHDEDADDADGDEPDDVIGARVLEAFLNDPILAERAIEISADADGGVLLHGRVWTSHEVAHAVTLAGGVPGVTEVRQRLRVRDRR